MSDSWMDIVLDRGHAQREEIQSFVNQHGNSVSNVDSSGWAAAVTAGQSKWVVLLDRRVLMSSDELQNLFLPRNEPTSNLELANKSENASQNLVEAAALQSSVIPIWLHPCLNSEESLRFVGENCPEAVSLCWNNPAEYSAVCVLRSSLPKLPAFNDDHPDVLWDWLVRAAGRPAVVASATTMLRGDWFVHLENPSGPISRPKAKNAPPSFGWPSCLPTPGLISQNPTPDKGWLMDHIQRAKPSHFVPDKSSEADAVAVKAGLLLWHDAADASHQLAQSIEGLGKRQAGDYWHAILHRREPDYGNAKYWFRQLGVHSVFRELIPHAARILDPVADGSVWNSRLWGKGNWDPFAFVDLCEACAAREGSPLGIAARHIQAVEMQLLMVATYQDASNYQAANQA